MHETSLTATGQRQPAAQNDETYDVIVVGAGFAGLAAAIEAHAHGASVVVLEKMKAAGGNSIISEGGIAAAGTDMQRRRGIKDSPDLMHEDMLKAGLGLNHPDLAREVASRSAETFQWSIDCLGVEYLDRIDQFGGHSVPRCLTTVDVSGASIIRRELEKLEQLGVEVRLQTRLSRFILTPDGRVSGVEVREGFDSRNPDTGTTRRLIARKAVILATGGFGGDVAFRSAQDPRLNADIDTTNKASATAEALVEALRIGAMPVQLSHIQLGPWGSPDEKGYGAGPRFADYVVFQLGMVVDPGTGNRFANEMADRKELSDAILAVGTPCVGIADSRAVEFSGWDIGRALQKGVVKTFSTLPELASHYGIPPDALEATMARFNAHIANGCDPDYGKPMLTGAEPLEHPPYYAIRLWPKVHFTMGGVGINLQAQVINLDGHRIEGLYAAGEVTGGVHGACRLGSCAITECLVFGRIAGRNAAIQVA